MKNLAHILVNNALTLDALINSALTGLDKAKRLRRVLHKATVSIRLLMSKYPFELRILADAFANLVISAQACLADCNPYS